MRRERWHWCWEKAWVAYFFRIQRPLVWVCMNSTGCSHSLHYRSLPAIEHYRCFLSSSLMSHTLTPREYLIGEQNCRGWRVARGILYSVQEG